MPAHVIENACLAIATLCHLNDENCSKLVEAEGCLALAALISSPDVPDSVLEAACRAVANTCCNHFLNQAQFGEAGGCESELNSLFISSYLTRVIINTRF